MGYLKTDGIADVCFAAALLFYFIEASFSGSLFHHFPQPNPATYCRRRTVDEYHELGV
ncbi:hypothetical protein ACF3NW_02085 [Eikenella halliae]|uniref:hypothetical protein n=1 Tax=Eikenella halliae TaxID=1795832 RepID=UPI00370DCF03